MNAFHDHHRQDLAVALKRLRISAGLTGYKLAELLGVDQSTVSKIERNRQRVSIAQVEQWCELTGASADLRNELRAYAEELLLRPPQSWKSASATGSTDFSRETREMEAAAGKLSFFLPEVVPGLLQTATYARRILSSGPDGVPSDVAERVVGRLERQRVLYDERKLIRIVVPETVLRWPFGPVDEHVEQLDRIGEVMARPNVDIRILPMTPNPLWRLGGFVLYEDLGEDPPLVHLELLSGPLNLEEPDQVDLYRRVFANLYDAALAGNAAKSLLLRVVAEMRGG